MTEKEFKHRKVALVKAVLADWSEETFTRRVASIDKEGNRVSARSIEAVKWCVVGELQKLSHPNDMQIRFAIREDFQRKYDLALTWCNDERGFKETKEKLEKLYD